MINSDLKNLIELQAIDKVIDQLEKSMKAVPAFIEAKRAEIKAQLDAYEAEKKKLTSLQLKKKEKEMEVGSQDDLVKKDEMQLNTIKSNDSYRAMLGEIENAKKKKSEIEDEILVIMEETEAELKLLKDTDASNKAAIQKIEAEIKAKEDEGAQIRSVLDAELKKREAFLPAVKKDLLTRYDYLRKKKNGLVIAAISGDCCSGCNTILTQMAINEVRKGKELVLCESCSCILYFPESPAAETAPASAS